MFCCDIVFTSALSCTTCGFFIEADSIAEGIVQLFFDSCSRKGDIFQRIVVPQLCSLSMC